MTFNATTSFDEGPADEHAIRHGRKIDDGRGASCRKHFLDAYAEHLRALRRDRTGK